DHSYHDTEHSYHDTDHSYRDTERSYRDTEHSYRDTGRSYHDTGRSYRDTERSYRDTGRPDHAAGGAGLGGLLFLPASRGFVRFSRGFRFLPRRSYSGYGYMYKFVVNLRVFNWFLI
ncbi:MAG: hypothetical protein LBF78_08325, partial [Treponema sp.]|nr:hypothetical protein [Treponema sp.]